MSSEKILIVGAGQAAAQASLSLRQKGFSGHITMLGDENSPPYQRPPLSKAYLMGLLERERLEFRNLESWQKENIDIQVSQIVSQIYRKEKYVTTQNGQKFDYDKAIIATGARVRKIAVEGANLAGINYLRNISEADLLKQSLGLAKNLVIIGAGYIGLEVAAVAAKAGLKVTVIELAPRVLARVACEELSGFYQKYHAKMGVEILTNSSLSHFEGNAKVERVVLSDGTKIKAEAVLVGIGVIPNIEVAKEAGLLVTNGIDTDENALSSDENIYATGDCANRVIWPYGERMRLESVHNAIEQGKIAAHHILGLEAPKLETPWFWSDQYDLKLQIAGLWNGAKKTILRGSMGENKFALFHFDGDDRLLAVDAVNSPPEFLGVKNLIPLRPRLDFDALTDISIPFKQIMTNALSASGQ